MLAKICGLLTPHAVDAAVQGGATHLGFVFHRDSPRDIDPSAAAELAGRAHGRAATVAVVVDPDDVLLDRLAREVRPDFFQLHGRETPDRVAEVSRQTGARVIKAIPAAGAHELDAAAAYEAGAEHLLIDAAPRDAGRPGGVGETFDWALLRGSGFAKPWFLAGGLTPGNVGAAVAATGASGVDVSSGVESAPGVKEPALIAAFLHAVHSTLRPS